MDYYAVFCNKYGYINYIFRKNGGWRLVLRSLFFTKYFFNRVYGSLDLDIFLKYFSIGFPHFGLGYFDMNLNENLHQC